ncbi:CHAT domain-containing protein [Cylindrospermopsis raciborskii]|nr:CHAT domain-containing protein [Cylindrospermopsis raciborskii]
MAINIVLRVLNGNFSEGFTIEIMTDSATETQTIVIGQNTNIPNLYTTWQNILHSYTTRKISSIEVQDTHVNEWNEWRSAKKNLQREYERWLETQCQVISSSITSTGSISSSIRTLIGRISSQNRELVRIHLIFSPTPSQSSQRDNDILRRLPWGPYFNSSIKSDNYDITFILSKKHPSRPIHTNLFSSKSPKILAIFGGHQGELASSQSNEGKKLREIWEPTGATVIVKNVTEQREFHELLINDSYDILFYSGHSSSQDGGTIQFEQETSIIRDFKNDLKEAKKKGLKIALFNSCDGLKIADFLTEEVGIPAVIVMKEPVPDEFAREFFERFLCRFVKENNCLSIAVDRAKNDILYREDKDFPGATWLPIIFYLYKQAEDFRISRFLYIKVVIHKIIKDSFLGVSKKLNNMFGIIQRLSRRQYMYRLIFLLLLFSVFLLKILIENYPLEGVIDIDILGIKNYPLEGVIDNILPANIVDIDISDDEQYVAYVDYVDRRNGIDRRNGRISLQKMNDLRKSSLCEIPIPENSLLSTKLVFKNKNTLAIATHYSSIDSDIRYLNVKNCKFEEKVIKSSNIRFKSLDFSTHKNVIVATRFDIEKDAMTTGLYHSDSGDNINIKGEDSVFEGVVDAKFWNSQEIILLKNNGQPKIEIYKIDVSNEDNSYKLELVHSLVLEKLKFEYAEKIVLSQDRKYISILGPGPIHIWEIDDKFKLKDIPKHIQNQLREKTNVQDAIFYKKKILISNTTSVDEKS